MIIFVTGTNTDVGKTVATAALASAFAQSGREVVYAKPLQTGEPDNSGDAATVRALAELTVREAQRRGINAMGLIGGSLPARPDLATRLNVDELPAVTGCRLWGRVPEGAGALGREDFARMARELFPGDVCAQLLAHAE